MARRLNYTGRRKLRRSDVLILLEKNTMPAGSFRALLTLDRYGFPPDAEVIIEAYRQTSWMRFSFGTVGHVSAPEDRSLSSFDNAEDVLFRLKIVAPDLPHGRLVGALDRIRPGSEGDDLQQRDPLLPVKPQDLGHQVWRVDIEDRPRLLVNSRFGDAIGLAREPGFMSLVFPAVLREVLRAAVVVDGHRGADDADEWQSQWIQFAMRLPGIGSTRLPDDDDQCLDWIEEVVNAFCRKHNSLETFANSLQAEGLS